jgi:hypothetical protein
MRWVLPAIRLETSTQWPVPSMAQFAALRDSRGERPFIGAMAAFGSIGRRLLGLAAAGRSADADGYSRRDGSGTIIETRERYEI